MDQINGWSDPSRKEILKTVFSFLPYPQLFGIGRVSKFFETCRKELLDSIKDISFNAFSSQDRLTNSLSQLKQRHAQLLQNLITGKASEQIISAKTLTTGFISNKLNIEKLIDINGFIWTIVTNQEKKILCWKNIINETESFTILDAPIGQTYVDHGLSNKNCFILGIEQIRNKYYNFLQIKNKCNFHTLELKVFRSTIFLSCFSSGVFFILDKIRGSDGFRLQKWNIDTLNAETIDDIVLPFAFSEVDAFTISAGKLVLATKTKTYNLETKEELVRTSTLNACHLENKLLKLSVDENKKIVQFYDKDDNREILSRKFEGVFKRSIELTSRFVLLEFEKKMIAIKLGKAVHDSFFWKYEFSCKDEYLVKEIKFFKDKIIVVRSKNDIDEIVILSFSFPQAN